MHFKCHRVYFRVIFAAKFATHFHKLSENEYMGFNEEYEVQLSFSISL